MKKQYHAKVAIGMVGYFEKKLEERKDKIDSVSKSDLKIARNGLQYYAYDLVAEEGVIDPKFEV